MPLRRRAFRPRRIIRRRRGYTGRRYGRRPVRRYTRSSVNLHRFVRWDKTIDPTNEPMKISCNFPSTGISPGSFDFRLSDVAAHTEFTTLYDQYIIDKVLVYFDYTPDDLPGLSGGASAPGIFPKLWVKRDYDDAATPTMTQMLQSNQAKCLRFTTNRMTRVMVIRPAFANEVYQSSTSTAYTTMRRQWLNCSNDSVPHYGLKCIAQGVPSQDLGSITVRVKYFLRFKNVR